MNTMENIKSIIEFLNGKKTYIVSGLFIAVQVAEMFGFIDQSLALSIQTLLIGTGLVTIRLAVGK